MLASNDTTTTRPGIRVHAASIIQGLHDRYGKQVSMLVQENAEITAALEAVQAERDELAAKLTALTGDE